jgi:uncharacterized protein YgbK (DUF1537 family)
MALIADDLTGASDAGVRFARRGLETLVLFELADLSNARWVEALALDTETRAVPPARAYRRVREVAEALRDTDPHHVYKKMDSTLRGNLGVEIEAVMDAFDFRVAVVAPAFPTLGRTTRGGVHFLGGVPVHETDIGRDPKAPVRESHLVQLLQRDTRRQVDLVDVDVIARGPDAIRAEMERLLARGVSVVVCDSEEDAHLQSIAQSMADQSGALWVGSAGLAEHVADALSLSGTRTSSIAPHLSGPILVVGGSTSETTRQQIHALKQRRGVVVVEIDPARLFNGIEHCEAELSRCWRALFQALSDGRDSAVVVRASSAGGEASERAARIADLLGTVAADCVRTHQLGGLILTGGDTARSVCRHLGVHGIHLLAEVEAGVPLGVLVGSPSARLRAVTKAGAFGAETTLVHALDHLKEGR